MLTIPSSFGFIKYHNFEDAENCIRGFHYLGYEVSFARVSSTSVVQPFQGPDPSQESFYSKLKKFADESNTNLYVSNIPKNMSEHVSCPSDSPCVRNHINSIQELSAIFSPHKVCSTRILRDPAGHGRGVGFARSVDSASGYTLLC